MVTNATMTYVSCRSGIRNDEQKWYSVTLMDEQNNVNTFFVSSELYDAADANLIMGDNINCDFRLMKFASGWNVRLIDFRK